MFKYILKRVLPKFKILKLAKILRFNSQFFFDVLIYHISKLFSGKVNNNLIVLGSANGKAFIGNPKYLYYYLKKNTDYELFYFVKSISLKKELENEGIKAIYAYCIEALRILRKARAVFVSHGYSDVLPFKKSSRTVFIQTWHGGDIKIIGNHPYFDKYINSKKAKFLGLKLQDSKLYDFVLSTSGEEKPLQILADAFKFPKEKILSFGYPRNDILFSNVSNLLKEFRNQYHIPNEVKTIILYAPTFREEFSSKNPFNDNELIELNNFCKEKDYIFLIKAHLHESVLDFKNLSNIKIVEKDADIQELLYLADILITDYSSVYFDYLLLNRPVILYTYDYEEYTSKRGIYYNHMEEISPGPIVYTVRELIDVLNNISEINKKYELKQLKLKKYFNKYCDGNSSERLLKFLKLIQ